MRTGDAYVASLRDGRAVFLDGERVKDVTDHPAFAEPIRRIAETYGRAHAAGTDPSLTFADSATGKRHSHMWLVPRSADDLAARRHHPPLVDHSQDSGLSSAHRSDLSDPSLARLLGGPA
jgi:4-hydroxyphenylacetate 3-monooxygenase